MMRQAVQVLALVTFDVPAGLDRTEVNDHAQCMPDMKWIGEAWRLRADLLRYPNMASYYRPRIVAAVCYARAFRQLKSA